MKNSVKFAGIAAASLLAVAPVATTTVSAATANTVASKTYTDKKFGAMFITRVVNPNNVDRAQVYSFNSTKNAMVPVSGKTFDQETLWASDKSRTLADGSVYYRVSTNEWLKSTQASQPYSSKDESGMKAANGVIKMPGNAKLHQNATYTVFSTFKESRVAVGSVKSETSWKYSATANNEEGQKMYRIGKNQWVLPQA